LAAHLRSSMSDFVFPHETGKLVYDRTYSRKKPDGTYETWPETVRRVVDGNLALGGGKHLIENEREELIQLMEEFKIIPGGRHLWASGVKGRQFLFNPVVGSSEVTTRDGVRKISELVDQTVEVLSMSDNCDYTRRQWESVGTWRPASFIYSGEQPTYRVCFESGREIVSTAEHVWYSTRSRSKLTTLQLVGKKIPVMAIPRPLEDGDYWIGAMRGIIFGDGTTTSDTPAGEPGKACIRMYGDDANELLDIFKKFGHRTQVHTDGIGYVGRLPRKWKKEFPSLNESASFWRGFFAGWFAADGTVDKQGSSYLFNKDAGILEQAREGFIKAGLVPTRGLVLQRQKNPFTGGPSSLFRMGFKRYSLTPRDFLLSHKRARFEANPVVVKIDYDTVSSVEATGISEPVFCCIEPATKSWTVNGVLTGNCHVSGWGETVSDHFEFTFMRLMEGGGVGANYSNKYLKEYPDLEQSLKVHVVCDPRHADYEQMKAAGLLSEQYDSDWEGAYEIEDSREGWAAAMVDFIETYYRPVESELHTNRVYDVSRVRPAGSRLKTFGGTASGPQPFAVLLHEIQRVMNVRVYGGPLTGMDAMEIDHAIAECVVSGGVRRSARMAIMHWNDPQIAKFLICKENTGKHWTTNISVEVDDDFFDIAADRTTHARVVLEAIAEGALNNGEPGMWNSSLSQVGEPNPVIATNPCGEITLEAWENCNLGHVNLGAFVDGASSLDIDGLTLAHMLMTRFLIRATFGDVTDSKQAEVLARNRRIGVGHFGFAAMIAKLGFAFSDVGKTTVAGSGTFDLLVDLAKTVDLAASEYCHDLRIPVPVKLRTVAPTGTIAKMPGTTEGIHTIFSRFFNRRIRLSKLDPKQVTQLAEYEAKGYHVEDDLAAVNTAVITIPTKDSLYAEVETLFGKAKADLIVQGANDLTLTEFLGVQRLYQQVWADNAVSFTINVQPDRYTVEEVAEALLEFGPDLKGTTLFPALSRPQSPYEEITEEEYNASTIHEIGDGVDEECANGSCPIR
jgi:adenosylcobalamin-dependent ribonucleoside-triphosphate reductase